MKARVWTILLAILIILSPLPCLAHWWDADGTVYTMSNKPEGNTVFIYDRSPNGELTFSEEVDTGGLGTGGGLGNQGGVLLSDDRQWLFVVNAGSNDISVFKVKKDGLYLVGTFDSGGEMPVSLTMNWRILYVLNAGVPNNITGFFIKLDGKLIPIPGSTRPLSADDTGPAQVGFSPYGDVLVVTEKATSMIDVYSIYKYGLASKPDFYDSVGETPFGFAFGRTNYLFVSEAAGGAADASSVSSYKLLWNDTLKVVSPAVPTNQTAACWVVVTGNGRFAYTTNAGSGSVAGYKIDYKGELSLLDPDGRTGDTGEGSGPIDMALSKDDKYLYTLNGGNNTISVFKVKWNGELIPVQVVEGLPPAANGLAAY